MYKPWSMFLIIGGLLLLLVSGCTGIGIYEPQATQVAFEGTVSALQSTIVAMQTVTSADVASATETPSPQVIVVTATETTSATPPLLSPTATASPTSRLASSATPTRIKQSSQGETIIVVEATATQGSTVTSTSKAELAIVEATATLPPTREISEIMPLTIEPEAGTVVEQGRNILLAWSWEGTLKADEHFDIKIRPDGQTSSAYVAWAEEMSLDWQADLVPGRYYWSVQVIRGTYKNGSRKPEDRMFEAFLGPESEPQLIIVGEKPEDNPRSISQADPPSPSLPFGLAAGSVAFLAFAGVTRRRIGL